MNPELKKVILCVKDSLTGKLNWLESETYKCEEPLTRKQMLNKLTIPSGVSIAGEPRETTHFLKKKFTPVYQNGMIIHFDITYEI